MWQDLVDFHLQSWHTREPAFAARWCSFTVLYRWHGIPKPYAGMVETLLQVPTFMNLLILVLLMFPSSRPAIGTAQFHVYPFVHS